MSLERLWATDLAGHRVSESWSGVKDSLPFPMTCDASQPAHTFLGVLEERAINQGNEQKNPTISKSLCFSKVFELLAWCICVPRWPCRLGRQSGRARSQTGSHHKIACFPSSFDGSRIDTPRLNVLLPNKTPWCHRHTMCAFRCPKLPKQGAGAKAWGDARESSEGKASHGVQNPNTFSDSQLLLRLET